MKSTLLVFGLVSFAIVTCVPIAYGGQVWTDGNGDGLPDACPNTFSMPPSANVTIGVWIDSQSFTWTNFLVYVEWTGDCLSYVSAQYVITGGNNFPGCDDCNPPNGFGWGGNGYNESGVDHIGNITVHINTPVSCCITPIIDIYNPYYVFSQLGNGSSYFLFSTNPGTCFGAPPPMNGACCFADGSCQEMDGFACTSAGGVYQGDCTFCSETDCAPETQACCFCPSGECQDLTIEDCIAAGGILMGPGTACGSPPCGCPPPTGACCFPDGSCTDTLMEPECIAAGGEWQGVYTICSGQCVSTSVEPSTWGRVKGLFR